MVHGVLLTSAAAASTAFAALDFGLGGRSLSPCDCLVLALGELVFFFFGVAGLVGTATGGSCCLVVGNIIDGTAAMGW